MPDKIVYTLGDKVQIIEEFKVAYLIMQQQLLLAIEYGYISPKEATHTGQRLFEIFVAFKDKIENATEIKSQVFEPLKTAENGY